jgi:hypothetical protein
MASENACPSSLTRHNKLNQEIKISQSYNRENSQRQRSTHVPTRKQFQLWNRNCYVNEKKKLIQQAVHIRLQSDKYYQHHEATKCRRTLEWSGLYLNRIGLQHCSIRCFYFSTFKLHLQKTEIHAINWQLMFSIHVPYFEVSESKDARRFQKYESPYCFSWFVCNTRRIVAHRSQMSAELIIRATSSFLSLSVSLPLVTIGESQ